MDLAIEPLAEKDVPKLARVLKSVADEEVHVTLPPGMLRENVEALVEGGLLRAEAGGGVELVAKLKGKIVGGGSLERGGYRQDHIGDVFTFVGKDYRGRGIGGRIVDALIADARSRGLSKLTVNVLAGNAPARDLLASRGFEQEGIRRRQFNLGFFEEDEVLYALFL